MKNTYTVDCNINSNVKGEKFENVINLNKKGNI